MRDYNLSDIALTDLAAARDWYDEQGEDLGRQLMDDVFQAIRVARERPMSCPQVEDEIRSIRCDRFPYKVYFLPAKDVIEVLAVYHTSRDPTKWQRRDQD